MARQSAQNFLNAPPNQVSLLPEVILDNLATKDWHQSITGRSRDHFVKKLVNEIFQTKNASILQDTRITLYARQIESDIYGAANSKDEYYQLLAEKVYDIREELREKQYKMLEIQLQQVQHMGPTLVPTNPSNSGAIRPINDEALQCSPHNLHHIQNAQSFQSLQSQVQLKPLFQNSATDAMASQSAQNFQKAPPNQDAPLVLKVILNNPVIVKDWHQSITEDLRKYLVQKIITAVFPTRNLSTLQNSKMPDLVTFAIKVEGGMYSTANSRDEYCQLMAKKVNNIRIEMDEKRQKRKDMQQQIQQMAPSLVPISPSNSGAPSPKLPVTSAISQLHNLNNSGKQQKVDPLNITVQTNTASPRSSDLYSPPSSQQSAMNYNLNMTNQSQFNELQAQYSTLQSSSLQPHFNNIAGRLTLANATVDATSIPATVNGIFNPQFNSVLQQTYPQTIDALRTRQRLRINQQQQQDQYQHLPYQQQSSPQMPSYSTALQISQSFIQKPQSQQTYMQQPPSARSALRTHPYAPQLNTVRLHTPQLDQPTQTYSNVKSLCSSELKIKDHNEEFQTILTTLQEAEGTSLNHTYTNKSTTPASSAFDKGSVQTVGEVFAFDSKISDSNCSEKIKIDSGTESENGKSEAIFDKFNEDPAENGMYVTGSSTKDESIMMKESSVPMSIDFNSEIKADSTNKKQLNLHENFDQIKKKRLSILRSSLS